MSIIRAPRPDGEFYVLDRRIAEDERLSWSARGLLIFLLTKPDHWQVSVGHLKKQTENARIKTGRDGVYALLAELIAAGYMTRGPQKRGEGGVLGEADYIVSEHPVQADLAAAKPAGPAGSEPLPAQPHTDQPYTAEPYTAKTTQARTDLKQELNTAKKQRRSAPLVEVPDWIPGEAWADWTDHRKSLRKPLTPKAAELAIRTLEALRREGQSPKRVIEQSIANGWTGLFPLKTHSGAAHETPRRLSAAERVRANCHRSEQRELAQHGFIRD